jgi:predicted glycosyltransferase
MIWFDLDNSPHVPLFRPVIKILEAKNIPYKITARDFAQTLALLKLWNIEHIPIGGHGGKNKIKKILNTYHRSSQLKKFAKDYNFSLAVSHGSRSQLIAASRLKIKSLLMLDYEYTETGIFNYFADYLLIPALIPDERLASCGINLKKVIRYNGFKEELYLSSFAPDPEFRKSINVPEERFLTVIRPPGMTGNYHDEKSEALLIKAIEYFSSFDNLTCLIIARTEKDRSYILSKIKLKENTKFLEKAVDGTQLVYAADIFLSGGGTMNRESALLGTKTYSIFTGRRPYLDEYLAGKGRMSFIENGGQVENIKIEKKTKSEISAFNNNLADEISQIIIRLAK